MANSVARQLFEADSDEPLVGRDLNDMIVHEKNLDALFEVDFESPDRRVLISGKVVCCQFRILAQTPFPDFGIGI